MVRRADRSRQSADLKHTLDLAIFDMKEAYRRIQIMSRMLGWVSRSRIHREMRHIRVGVALIDDFSPEISGDMLCSEFTFDASHLPRVDTKAASKAQNGSEALG